MVQEGISSFCLHAFGALLVLGVDVHNNYSVPSLCVTHENYVLLHTHTQFFCLFFRSFVRRTAVMNAINCDWNCELTVCCSENYKSDGKWHDITACLHLEISYVFFKYWIHLSSCDCDTHTYKHNVHCLTGKEPYLTKEMVSEWKSFLLQNITPFKSFVNNRNVRATNCDTAHASNALYLNG